MHQCNVGAVCTSKSALFGSTHHSKHHKLNTTHMQNNKVHVVINVMSHACKAKKPIHKHIQTSRCDFASRCGKPLPEVLPVPYGIRASQSGAQRRVHLNTLVLRSAMLQALASSCCRAVNIHDIHTCGKATPHIKVLPVPFWFRASWMGTTSGSPSGAVLVSCLGDGGSTTGAPKNFQAAP